MANYDRLYLEYVRDWYKLKSSGYEMRREDPLPKSLYIQMRLDLRQHSRERVAQGKSPITHIQREVLGGATTVSSRQSRVLANSAPDALKALQGNEKALNRALKRNPEIKELFGLTSTQIFNKLKRDSRFKDILFDSLPKAYTYSKNRTGRVYRATWIDSH